MKLSLLELLEATGGRMRPEAVRDVTFGSFHTDSREVRRGGVFFALKGSEQDGHRFVPDAARQGAAAVVVDRPVDVPAGVSVIVVVDTWEALYQAARFTLNHIRPLVVAVTGSNGKTSTREMVAHILETRFQVLKTSRNLNTETGVPLTVLGLEPHHTALVLEMGMQRAGDIGRLAALAGPQIGVVTNVGTVHLEFFESREDLARAKGELLAALPDDGVAVLNADNEFYPLLAQMTSARIATFGLERGDYRVERYRAVPGGSEFEVRGVAVTLGMTGRHQAVNAAAALAAGEGAGIDLGVGARALRAVHVEHRLQELVSPHGLVVIDDAYNASPESMLAAFEAVADSSTGGRLYAVLGDMAELGEQTLEAHRRVGRRAAEVFAACCVIDSERGRILAEAAGADLVPDGHAAAAWVLARALPGDHVLVKGSHASRLDLVVRELQLP